VNICEAYISFLCLHHMGISVSEKSWMLGCDLAIMSHQGYWGFFWIGKGKGIVKIPNSHEKLPNLRFFIKYLVNGLLHYHVTVAVC